MTAALVFIGFGEAGAAFAGATPARGYDLAIDDPARRRAKLDDFARAGVAACDTAAEAFADAHAILSLVTADQALIAAQAAAPLLERGALWFDMNSVAPGTKRAAAAAIESAGARYVDVAIMSPVHPARRNVPLLVCGPHAEAGADLLTELGFTNVTAIGGGVGTASSIKMIRSVMVKGLEALTAECFLAAHAAGVTEQLLASLDAGWAAGGWACRADYNFERMMVHGLRRAAEMEEVVTTLDELGTGSAMTRGTVERQRAIGELGLAAPEGLTAKLDKLGTCRKDEAA